jgi:hypothetical protein
MMALVFGHPRRLQTIYPFGVGIFEADNGTADTIGYGDLHKSPDLAGSAPKEPPEQEPEGMGLDQSA